MLDIVNVGDRNSLGSPHFGTLEILREDILRGFTGQDHARALPFIKRIQQFKTKVLLTGKRAQSSVDF